MNIKIVKTLLEACCTSLSIPNSFTLGDGVNINIIDTGAGLASVISLPNNNYIIYDTGHWQAIRETK